MGTAEFGKLPGELREEIWLFALLPEPGVYKFDPDRFIPRLDVDGWEDERWMISKRRYPTAMHLCQESRRFAFQIKTQEEKEEQENNNAPYYCLGEPARPFNTVADTFWFSEESLFNHPWVRNLTSVIGDRLHIIENLALSSKCITIHAPGTIVPSAWNSFRWDRLLRCRSLRRVDVIFAERCVDEDDAGNPNSSSSSDLEKVTELRLKKWTEGPWTETADEVETLMKNVRMSMLEAFQDVYDRMLEGDIEELLPFPEGIPDWHDGSSIIFHAAQVVKDKTF
jgi:hypothetical protein